MTATESQDPSSCFVSVRIREWRRRQPGATWACVKKTRKVTERNKVCASVCLRGLMCVLEDGRSAGKKKKNLNALPPKSLSCVIGAVPLSPCYLHAQTGYRFLCAGWLCNLHQMSTTQHWPVFLSLLPLSKLIWRIRKKLLCFAAVFNPWTRLSF